MDEEDEKCRIAYDKEYFQLNDLIKFFSNIAIQ